MISITLDYYHYVIYNNPLNPTLATRVVKHKYNIHQISYYFVSKLYSKRLKSSKREMT